MPFRDVVGHRRLIDLLARSIRRDRLPPSLLFAGPDNGATRHMAIAVAQALNCTQLTTDESVPLDSCGRCSTCTRIARGMHPDVLVVEPGDTGSIKIEQVRDVVDRSSYRPFEGRRRVVIVDDASGLVIAAQNALLKTLEEPPASSVFILVTSYPDVLLPTVRSRLIRLMFAETGPATIDSDVRTVAERVLAEAATGGPERRLAMAQQFLHPRQGMDAPRSREHLASHLSAVGVLLRDAAVLATGAPDRLLAQPDSRPALDRLKETFGGARGPRAFFAVDQALTAIESNVGVKVVADWVAVQL